VTAAGRQAAAPGGLARTAFRITALAGWRRLALAVAAGALASLALDPVSAVPVLWLALPVLALLVDGAVAGAPGRRRGVATAALVGWGFGLGYFLGGLWWVGAAFLVEAEEFAWALPLGVLALPAGMALYMGLGTAIAALLWRPGAPGILALAVGLAVSEWLRGHLFTGFPWNGLGTAAAAGEVPMQAAALLGAYGLVPVAVVVFSAPAAFLMPGASRRGAVVLAAAAVAIAAALLGWGAWRLAGTGGATVPGVNLRIVQPAIGQVEKWKPENRWWIFDRLLALTKVEAPPAGETTVVIWPESSTPFLLNTSPLALEAIAEVLPEGTALIAGAGRGVPDPARPEGPLAIYNSALVVDSDGRIGDVYDKVHLVPFGEYLPFQAMLEGLGVSQLARMPGGFAAGPARKALAVPGAPPASPLVCYEIIFPGEALPAAGPRPGWILNLTNDAWFGVTPGPYQHLHQARLRAIEEGLPVVRAANTGISAIIDPYGRVAAELGLEATGALDGRLPAALAPPPYARFGDWPLFAAVAAAAAWLALGRRRRA